MDATRRRLADCGREATPEGVLALDLAAQLGGSHSGASIAALANAYAKALDAATKGAPRQADVLDEIKARRDQRRGA